jgi:hypothetical protein
MKERDVVEMKACAAWGAAFDRALIALIQVPMNSLNQAETGAREIADMAYRSAKRSLEGGLG